jgi:excisionase family DNA binding protein
MFTKEEAAALLHLRPRTVHGMIKSGRIHGVYLGNRIRVSAAELVRVVAEGIPGPRRGRKA